MADAAHPSPFSPVSPTGYSYNIHSQPNASSLDNGSHLTGAWAVTESPTLTEDCSNISSIPWIISRETLTGLGGFSKQYSGLHGYVSTAVCLFGLMSNSANIIVLTRKNMISSTNTILMWLAVADLLTMMSYLPFAIHFYIMKEPELGVFFTRSFGWIIFLMFHASFSIVCHTVAIWLTIALAIFRYIYICMPTKGSVYCSLRRAKITIFVVYVLTVMLCTPNYFTNRYSSSHDAPPNGSGLPHYDDNSNSSNGTDDVTRAAARQPDSSAALVYQPIPWTGSTTADITSQVNNWIQAILIKLIPCGMLTTLTILLIHAMHKAYRKRLLLKSQGRKAESDKHGEHNRTTGMLLAVVVLFTITELPQGILTLMNIFMSCFRDVVYNSLGDLLDAMALINNSVNFVLYCSMSRQFRETFVQVFCSFCTQHRPGWLKLKLITSTDHGNGQTTAVTAVDAPASEQNHTHV